MQSITSAVKNIPENIKYYYNAAAETNWIRYLVYILVFIGIIAICYIIIFRRNAYSRSEAGRIYNAPEATQAVAIDKNYFYAISRNSVGKYDRKTGKRVLRKVYPFRNIKNGKIVNNDLVLVDGTRGKNMLVWISPNDLKIIDVMEMTFIQGTLTWFDWFMGKWWICDSGKRAQNTKIYCFSDNWVIEGFWKLPKNLIEELGGNSGILLGGAWFGEYLFVTGSEKPEMYLLDMPADKINAKLMKNIQVCFDGHGFTFERGKGAIYGWGVRSEDAVVVRCAIDIDETEAIDENNEDSDYESDS